MLDICIVCSDVPVNSGGKYCSKQCSEKHYRAKNKEKYKEYQQQWRLNNKDKVKSYNKRHRHYIAGSMREYHKEYQKERYNSDVNFRLRKRLRDRLYQAIKKGQKSGSAVEDLGCSICEFKRHIESRFQPGMTWENYGQWEIDHIKPLINFDLENRNEFLEACNYKNMQPLWKDDHLRKTLKDIEVYRAEK